jgi:hypothetical protein
VLSTVERLFQVLFLSRAEEGFKNWYCPENGANFLAGGRMGAHGRTENSYCPGSTGSLGSTAFVFSDVRCIPSSKSCIGCLLNAFEFCRSNLETFSLSAYV